MAYSNRDEATTVGEVDDTLRRARELGFFRFVALVERLAEGAVRIGDDGPLNAEAIRFRHDPALTFSASDISSVRVLAGEHLRFEVMTTFLGLTGAVTPLPLYFSEELSEVDGQGVQTDFIDLFHHRLLSLLYRAFIKYQLAAEATEKGVDAWARRLLALAGVDSLTQREVLDPGTLLSLLPAMVCARRSPDALENALVAVLGPELPAGAAVHVEPFVGEWAPLDKRDVCRLGVANSRLGAELVLGSRIFDRAGKFRIEIGPVDAEAFRRLAAGGPLRARIDALVALFVNDWLSYEVKVVADQARSRLTLSAAGSGSRLGVDSWLSPAAARSSSTSAERGATRPEAKRR